MKVVESLTSEGLKVLNSSCITDTFHISPSPYVFYVTVKYRDHYEDPWSSLCPNSKSEFRSGKSSQEKIFVYFYLFIPYEVLKRTVVRKNFLFI